MRSASKASSTINPATIGLPKISVTDPNESLAGGDLITHEFSHSWNGKYRRPADLTTLNFQVPQLTDLLWVYEGMNEYLGDLLSFRAGIREPKQYPEFLATLYGAMDTETGRATTPLIDLTTGAPYYFLARGDYGAIRRNAGDFYTEGELVWLDVDTIIRERSHGARSLDTFLQAYTKPALTGPIVKTYTRAEIEALLEEVEPYDWHAFFETYVYRDERSPAFRRARARRMEVRLQRKARHLHHRIRGRQPRDPGMVFLRRQLKRQGYGARRT